MTTPLSNKDYMLISAYLDGELAPSQRADVEKHLDSDLQFREALVSLKYTKRLLSSQPPVRARRNFTLTADKVKKTAKSQRFQPAWGMVSAFSTLMLIVVFAVSRFAPSMSAMPAAAPPMAIAQDKTTAMEAQSAEGTPTPMIILWAPQRAYGMGGGGGVGGGEGTGGGDGMTTGLKNTGVEAPMAAAPNPAVAPTLSATEGPAPASAFDPSTLILGIPDAASRGQVVNAETMDHFAWLRAISSTTWLMIASGALALIAALLAIFTRRR